MKRLFLALATIGFSVPGLAFTSSSIFSTNSAFDGFYIGAGVGNNTTVADIDTSSIATTFTTAVFLPLFTTLQDQSSSGAWNDSVLGEIHLGWGHAIGSSPFYLSAEAFGNATDRRVDVNTNTQFVPTFTPLQTNGAAIGFKNTDTDVKLRAAEWGVDLRPGILLAPTTLLYGRIGAAFNKATINLNSNITNTGYLFIAIPPAPPVLRSQLQPEETKNLTGLRLGGGLEQFVTPHVAIKADYIYTNYGKVTVAGSGNTLAGQALIPSALIIPNGYKGNASADLDSHTILLGADYYFSAQDYCLPGLFAAQLDPQASNFNGFYAGLKAGVIQTESDNTINALANEPIIAFIPQQNTTTEISLSHSSSPWTNDAAGEFFLGYGHLIASSPFYLGAEVYVNGTSHRELENTASNTSSVLLAPPIFSPGSNVISTLTNATQVKLRSVEYGADIRPGVLVSAQTLLYGRVGFAENRLDLNTDNVAVANTIDTDGTLTPFTSALSSNEEKNITGLRLGAGIEEYLGCHWSATFDYIYTDYGRVEINQIGNAPGFTGGGGTATPAFNTDGFTTHTSANVKSQSEMLGITYHFGHVTA